jgi:DNA-directed RNA polymerase alpha subunit
MERKLGDPRGNEELPAVILVLRAANENEANMPKRRFHWEKEPTARPSDLVIRSSLPQWVVRVLRQSGIKRMSIIAALSDEELLKVPGIGRRSLALIREEISRTKQVEKGLNATLNTSSSTPAPIA